MELPAFPRQYQNNLSFCIERSERDYQLALLDDVTSQTQVEGAFVGGNTLASY